MTGGITMLGLRTIIYKVPDLAAAKTWYSAILGFEPYFAEAYYVGFQVGGFELGLDPDMTGVVAGAGAGAGGGVVAYWGVADAGAAYDRMLALGAGAHEPAREVGGGIRVAAVKDPFGNVLGVIENPHFSTANVR
jgi:predicted enzyme related to lactoylglutathione lyase